jgi:hypothetical protein
MNCRFMKRLLYVAIAVVINPFVLAQQQPDPRGVWSSLCLNSESGDLNGMEIMVMPGSEESLYRALVQITDGGTLPYTALVELRVPGEGIEFSVPEDWGWPQRRFTGKFEKGQLVVESPLGLAERLPRGHSYWEFLSQGDCR